MEGVGHLGVARSAAYGGLVLFDSLGGGNPKGRPSSAHGYWSGMRTHFDMVHLEMATGTYPTGSGHPYLYPRSLNFTRRVTCTRTWIGK